MSKTITFDLTEIKKLFPITEYWDGCWYDQEEIYLDEDTGNVIRRVYRGDKYTNQDHPEWEHKQILCKGFIQGD